MNKAQFAAQIIGILFGCAGIYVIGNWQVASGIFLMFWGNNMMVTIPPKDETKGPGLIKDWLGNKHVE